MKQGGKMRKRSLGNGKIMEIMTNEEKLEYINEAHRLTMRYRLWDMPGKSVEELKRIDYKSWEEFSSLLLPRIPKTFFRYRSFTEYSIDELKNGYVWFSHPEDFDDGTDSALNTDIEAEISEFETSPEKVIVPLARAIILQQYRKLSGHDPDNRLIQEGVKLWPNGKLDIGAMTSAFHRFCPNQDPSLFISMIEHFNGSEAEETLKKPLREMFDYYMDLNEKTRSNLLCLCLAEDYSNDVMWAKYAGERTGFCVGYEIDDSGIIGQRYLLALKPIYYGEKKALRFFDIMIEGLTVREEDTIYGWPKKTYEEINLATLTKPFDWMFQKEWRIVFSPEAGGNKHPFPFTKSIYLGEKMDAKHRELLIDIAAENGWKIYERKLNKSGSKIIYVPLK